MTLSRSLLAHSVFLHGVLMGPHTAGARKHLGGKLSTEHSSSSTRTAFPAHTTLGRKEKVTFPLTFVCWSSLCWHRHRASDWAQVKGLPELQVQEPHL